MNLQVIKDRNYELNANSEKFKHKVYGALQLEIVLVESAKW